MPEKRYVVYDPGCQAYREVSQEDAIKFVESAKKVQAALEAEGVM